jgi:transposase
MLGIKYPHQERSQRVPKQHRPRPKGRDPHPGNQHLHPTGSGGIPQEVHRIVLEGFRREVAVSDLCRREGIRPGTFYAWTKEFMEAGKERLTRDTSRDATRQEIESLKRENHDLKELVADLSLEVYRFKKTAIPALENTSV